MRFFADTASLDEIKYSFSRGVDEGITTNPKIIELTGDLSLGFEGACKSILSQYPNVPVSLETDLRGIDVTNLESVNPNEVRDTLLQQAEVLSKWASNVVVKIPVCEGGLLAAKELAKRGIKTNITACMTPYQALTASQFGVGYVSLFANRILDSHILELAGHSLEKITLDPDWKTLVSVARDKYFEKAWEMTLNEISYVASQLDNNPNSALIVGSIRSPEDIYRLTKAEPQVITIPTKIVKGLEKIRELKETRRSIIPKNIVVGDSIHHPMTQYTLEEFEKAAEVYRR